MTVEDAVELIKIACTKWRFGYDQHNRLAFYDGGETDCSALVIIVCERSGLLPGNDIRKKIGATYTGDMRKNFKKQGWKEYTKLTEAELKPGDVLLDPGHHTVMYVGKGEIAQARIDENGNEWGGESGRAENGRETVVSDYYNRPWPYILRFHGTAKPSAPAKLEVDGEFGVESTKRLQAILHIPQSGTIDKGTFKALQVHIGAPYQDGIASHQDAKVIEAHWPTLTAFTTGHGSSSSVKTLQARLGMDKSGKLDEKTARALQKRLNTGKL